jgi:nucleoside-diphosphate-sugar epimerase
MWLRSGDRIFGYATPATSGSTARGRVTSSRGGSARCWLHPIEVFDAANIFDYVHAGDVAEALARLAGTPAASGIFNVPTAQGARIRDVVAALGAAGLATEGLVTEQPDEAPCEANVADVSRLRDVVGWVPPTDIRERIAHLIEHEE